MKITTVNNRIYSETKTPNFKMNPYFEKNFNMLAKGDIAQIKNFKIYDENGDSLLHRYAKGLMREDILDLLCSHLPVNQRNFSGQTALMYAVKSGKLENVQMLYQKGADINIQNNNGSFPMMEAINFEDIFKYLMEKGANLNNKNSFGVGLVHVFWNNIEKLKILQNKGADINLRDSQGQNILHYAVSADDKDLTKQQVELGIDLNKTDFKNKSPIFYTNNFDMFTFLHNAGADLSGQDIYGNSLLHNAIINKNYEIFDYLLKNDINPNLENIKGLTPLFLSLDYSDYLDKLIAAGADVQYRDNLGQTLLHKAAKKADVNLFLKIMSCGVDAYIKDNSGKTAIDIAKENNCYAISNIFQTGTKGFAKVIGMDELKQELTQTVIEPLTQKDKYQKYGLSVSNGILLHGLPGCGKTFIAKALAEECGRNFYELKTSDFSSPYLGVGTNAISRIFNEARKHPPSMIFIDEMDGLPKRSNSDDAVSSDNNQIINELLQQMNNLQEDNIFVIGATNNPEVIDPAIKRPGRLDKKIFVPPPDLSARLSMFRKELAVRPCKKDIKFSILAKNTENYIAQEIKIIVDNASRQAMKENRDITMNDLLNSIKSVKPSINKNDISKYKSKISLSDTAGVKNNQNLEQKTTGFEKVAGMKELKKILYNDVILPLKESNEYKKYGLEAANGILLYGPPGTGKTFIATALAEECDRYFVKIKPSDVLSSYYGETTQNIKRVFEDAEYNAPAIIFIDEIEALAPSRKYGHSVSSNQVTELLQQLNNCFDKDIFVIAATNEPQQIDEAIRRIGRFDKTVFVPPPDFESRKELFKMILQKRYVERDIDYDLLAQKTENYTASEINKVIVNGAAHIAKDEKRPIAMQDILNMISKTRPQLSSEMVEEYRHKINA